MLGLDLIDWFGDQLREAVSRQMPIFGVCNGFQALVAAGLLPSVGGPAALVENDSGSFECRWVTLAPTGVSSVWLEGVTEPLRCPVAHAEGRLQVADDAAIGPAIALRYADDDGSPAGGRYPLNPNGSVSDAAGLVDSTGMILGLMPHPEDHVLPRQDPLRGRPGAGGRCLTLFRSGVSAVGG